MSGMMEIVMTLLEKFVKDNWNPNPEFFTCNQERCAFNTLRAFAKLVRERAEQNEGNRGRITEFRATGLAFNEIVKELGLEGGDAK